MKQTYLPVKVNAIKMIIFHKLHDVLRSNHWVPLLSGGVNAAATSRNHDFDVVLVVVVHTFTLLSL